MPPSELESLTEGFGAVMKNLGISWREAAKAMNEMVVILMEQAYEAVEREDRLHAAPEVLRKVVAQHLNDDMRALVWSIANDLEEHLDEDEAVEELEDNEVWHVEWTRRGARKRRTGS